MKRYMKNLVASLLLVVFIISSYLPVVAVGSQPSSYSSTYNSGERDVVATTLDGTSADEYYTGIYTYDNLSEQSGSQLLTSLHNLMTSTHRYISTYANCRDYSVNTDCENNDGRIVTLYTSYSATYSQYNNGLGWNREHVWPQSLGGGNTSGGGADLHHVRPSENSPNSTRGNKLYGYANGGKTVTGNLSGYSAGCYSTYYEPLDNVKGDVARIVLYVYVRWGSAWGADSVTEVFQSVDVLLEWCELDPVDTWELGRNEVVEGIQGNRNVFIDYPEFAWLLFGREVPSDMVTPSGEAMNGNGGTPTPNPTPTPDPDPSCDHQHKELRGYVAVSCFTDGYTGDYYCVECDEKIDEGTVIPAKNEHSFDDWQPSDDGQTYIKHCGVCGYEQVMLVTDVVAILDDNAEKILLFISLGVCDGMLLDALYQQTQ